MTLHSETGRERWAEVDRLFEAALDQPPEHRRVWLAEACGDDEWLLGELTALLAAAEHPEAQAEAPGPELLEAALAERTRRLPVQNDELPAGELVGRFRIVRPIGRGGMATVYEAERADGVFSRRVAVKVLRRGLDTEDVVRRFRDERQILSQLSHPGIAHLLDGGATRDGRPFLAMELVEGEPVTDWASRRDLRLPERLRLFLQVLEAVRFAHGRLVIHRDIKPGNVMVDDQGQVKLLDFGIAKILGSDEEGAGTHTLGQLPMTPEFASPEQLRGEPVTTTSDVFQLGALLYLILTDRNPWKRRSTGPGWSSRDPVPKPSDVTPAGMRRSLRGDLDTIVLTALRNAPEERYPSVEALAEDVRRYLDGRPIHARPASPGYRLRKFVRRNPWLTATIALLLMTTAAYVLSLSRQARKLEAERNEATAHANRAEALRSLLVGQFQSADPYGDDPQSAREITVEEAIQRSADQARIDLSDQPLLLAGILSDVAEVEANLDMPDAAATLLRECMDLRIAAGEAGSTAQMDDLGRMSGLMNRTGHADSAVAYAEESLARERATFGPRHPRVAEALGRLAGAVGSTGDLERAKALREEDVEILRENAPAQNGVLASELSMLADVYRDFDELQRAEDAARESLELYRRTLPPTHPNVAESEVHLAQVLASRGDLGESVELYRRALPVLEETLGPTHFITLNSWNDLGLVLMESHDYVGAEEVHRRILEIQRTKWGTDHNRDVANSLQNLAATLVRRGAYREADSLAALTHDLYVDLLGPRQAVVAFPLLTRAEIRLAQGDGPGAQAMAQAAVDILASALPTNHFATAAARCRVGEGLALQHRGDEADPIMAAALETLEASQAAPDRLVNECRDALATLRNGTGPTGGSPGG